MSPRDLIHDPCWQGNDLGHPLPDATHAVSVALPRWSDVIAFGTSGIFTLRYLIRPAGAIGR